MDLITLTRPDGSAVAINVQEILAVAPVPELGSASSGPLSEGTRLSYRHGGHQDVTEGMAAIIEELEGLGG